MKNHRQEIFKCWFEVVRVLKFLGLLHNEENRIIHQVITAIVQLIFVHFIWIAQGFKIFETFTSNQNFFQKVQTIFIFLTICSLNLRSVLFKTKKRSIMNIKQKIENLTSEFDLKIGQNTIAVDLRLSHRFRRFMIVCLLSITALATASLINIQRRSLTLNLWVPFNDFEKVYKYILSLLFAMIFGYNAFLNQLSIDFSSLCCLGLLRGIILDFCETIDQTHEKLDLENFTKFSMELKNLHFEIDKLISETSLPQTIFGSLTISMVAYCCIYVS